MALGPAGSLSTAHEGALAACWNTADCEAAHEQAGQHCRMSSLSLTRAADCVSSALYCGSSVQQGDLQSYETQLGAINTLNVMGLSPRVAVHG